MSEIWCLHANRKTCLEWLFSPCNNQTGCLSAVNAALPRSADYQSTCSSPCLIVFPRSCFHLQFHGWLLTMQGFLLACLFLPFLGYPCLLSSTLNCALLASVIYVFFMNNNSTIPDSDYSVFICRRLRCSVIAANGWVHGFAFVSILNASATLRTRLKGKNVSFLRPYSGRVCFSGKSMAEATKVVHFLRFHPE